MATWDNSDLQSCKVVDLCSYKVEEDPMQNALHVPLGTKVNSGNPGRVMKRSQDVLDYPMATWKNSDLGLIVSWMATWGNSDLGLTGSSP